jgi:flagellar basal-body rod protein FlgB
MLQALDDYLHTRLTALGLHAKRSEVLASNIANADTPNYKARDFDFASALRSAMGNAQARIALERTDRGHLSGPKGLDVPAGLQYRLPVQPSIDGNTVELDQELAQFSDNALRYQANLTFLNQQIALLRSAIAGQ